MCVIIDKPEGVIIEPSKIESACITNPHGYGLGVYNKGKLTVKKDLEESGNDPDKVNQLLEKYKDNRVLLHLRFNTVGKTNRVNCHPFSLLTKKKHGISSFLMHNGTIHDFKKDGDASDTNRFAREFVSPLFERSLSTIAPEQLLKDPLLMQILTRFIPSTSVITIFDSTGNVITFNGSKGYEDKDGWWASNSYSFNRNHRTPISTTVHPSTHSRTTYPTRPTPNQPTKQTPTTGAVTNSPKKITDTASTNGGGSVVSSIAGENKALWYGESTPVHLSPETTVNLECRETVYNTLADSAFNNLADLSYGQLEELVLDYPDDAVRILFAMQKKIKRKQI